MARAPRRTADRAPLSPDWAFVVQLADGRDLAGRVEHLTSGEARRFASLEDLVMFMARFRGRRGRPRSPLGPPALFLVAALAANVGPAAGQVEFVGSDLRGTTRAEFGGRTPCANNIGPIENASLASQEFPCSVEPPGSTLDASTTVAFQLDPPTPAVGGELRRFTVSVAGSLDVDVTQSENVNGVAFVSASVSVMAVAGQSFTLSTSHDLQVPDGVVFSGTNIGILFTGAAGVGTFVTDSDGLFDTLPRSGVFPVSGEYQISVQFVLAISTIGRNLLISEDQLLNGSVELSVQFGPPRGACCLPAGACAELTLEACQAVGDFQGADTTCASAGICDVDEEVVDWTSATGGAFATATNWTPETVPDQDQTARFALAGSYPVGVTSARVRRLLVRLGTMFLSGGTLETTETDLAVPSVGVGGDGRLNLGAGLLATAHVALGDEGPGTAEVSGAQAQWTSTGRLVVGQAAAGELRINDGGGVTSAESRIGEGAEGKVVLEDLGATWQTGNLAVGSAAVGLLSVLAAASVESGDAVLGLANGGDGTVTVAGSVDPQRSVWSIDGVAPGTGTLTVGQGGRGLLRIEDGGGVFVGTLRVIRGSVQIGRNGDLFVTNRLEVGGADSGFVTVEEGRVLVKDVVIAGDGASTGSLQLFGKGEPPANLEHFGELRVHRGNVRLFGGAIARGARGVVAGPAADVLIQGTGAGGPSTWDLGERLDIGETAAGTITLQGGTVRVLGCGFHLHAAGRLAGVGTFERVGCPPTPSGEPPIEPLVAGTIEPGVQLAFAPAAATAAQANARRPAPRVLTAGELVVAGDLALGPTALVRIPVAGPGQAGVLHVTGNAALAGALEIAPVDGYLPRAGDTVDVLRVDGTTAGAFAATQVRGVADDFAFTVAGEGGVLRLVAESDAQVSPCADAQDNDGDGRTDCADPACAGDLACAVPPAEVCGNCRDDDGNGLVDVEDPACCGGAAPGALAVAAGKLRTRADGSRLALALALRETTVDPAAAPEVVVQVVPAAGAPLCARIPAAMFARKGKKLRFVDRRRAVGSARGLDAIVLRGTERAARLVVKGRRTALVPPTEAGPLRVAVALRAAGGAEVEPRCMAGQRAFDATRKGVLAR